MSSFTNFQSVATTLYYFQKKKMAPWFINGVVTADCLYGCGAAQKGSWSIMGDESFLMFLKMEKNSISYKGV